jgi:hypothetical protein
MLDFSNFKAVATANEKLGNRTPLGQSFDFKYRKFMSEKGGKESIESNFTISNKKFDELGLSEKGLLQVIDPTTNITYLAVVGNDDAVMMKRTNKLAADAEKGKKFKSTIVEEALHAQGVIDTTIVGDSQKLTLTLVAENVAIGSKGIQASSVWEIGKAVVTDEEKAALAQEDADDAHDSVEETMNVADTQESQANAVEDDDEF